MRFRITLVSGGSCLQEAHGGQSRGLGNMIWFEHRLFFEIRPSYWLDFQWVSCSVLGTVLSPSGVSNPGNHPNNLVRKVLLLFPVTRQGHLVTGPLMTGPQSHPGGGRSWHSGLCPELRGPPGKQPVLYFKTIESESLITSLDFALRLWFRSSSATYQLSGELHKYI